MRSCAPTSGKAFDKDCQQRRWSMQRISRVLAAPDAAALGACDAMPSPPMEITAGDAKAWRTAAQDQA